MQTRERTIITTAQRTAAFSRAGYFYLGALFTLGLYPYLYCGRRW